MKTINLKNILCITLLFVVTIVLSGCKSNDYDAAKQLLDNNNYELAAVEFIKLGDYKDSKKLAEDALFANELVSSDIYKKLYSAALSFSESTGSIIDASYKAQERAFVVNEHSVFSKEFMDNLSEAQLEEWTDTMNALNEESALFQQWFYYYGFKVDCKLSFFSSDDVLLCESINGITNYDYVGRRN